MSTIWLVKTVDQLEASTNQTTTSSSSSSIDRDISDISHKCSATAAELLKELNRLKVRKEDGKRKILISSFRAMRGKDPIKEIQDRLDKYKRLLDTRILVRLDAHSLQQRNDFSSLSREVQNLTLTLNQGQKTVDQLLPILETQHQALSDQIDRQLVQHSRLESERAAEKVFKESLFFPEILARQEQIKEAHQGTCQWIFQSRQNKTMHETDDERQSIEEQPWSDFSEWLQIDQELYWISGKAGSGKSTLMEYLRSERSQIETKLTHWAGDSHLVTVFFYFWNPGTEIQKSLRGLLRSLLYQIIHQQPDLISVMMDNHQASNKEPNGVSTSFQLHEWTERRLLTCLERFLKHKPTSLSLCFFIDGLDEFVGDQDLLLETVRMLCTSSQVKVCVSSRPEQIFREAYRNLPQLKLPDFNRKDIQKTTDDKLKPMLLRKFPSQEEDVLRFISTLSEKAQGVFLWLDLVIRDVVNGARNGDTLRELEERLDIMPESIEGLYSHMLDKLDKAYLAEAGHYFRVLASTSFNGLSCNMLSFACMEDQPWKNSLQDNKTYFTSNSFLQLCENLETRILTRCAGLVEIEGPRHKGSRINHYTHLSDYQPDEVPLGKSNLSSYWRVVSFIHRSASDFVRQHYMERFNYANWYSIGNLEYARGTICTVALLPMLLASEWLLQSIQVNRKIVLSLERYMVDIAFLLYIADEHRPSGPTDLAFTNDLFQTTEHLYNILRDIEEHMKNLIAPMDPDWDISVVSYLRYFNSCNDAISLASYLGLRSAVLPRLASKIYDHDYLNHLLMSTTAGLSNPRAQEDDCSAYVEIVEALLDLGADANLIVCTQIWPTGRCLKMEESAWAHFLRAATLDNHRSPTTSSRLRILLPRLFRGSGRNTSVLSLQLFRVTEHQDFNGWISIIREESSLSYLKHLRTKGDMQGWSELEHLVRSLSPSERTRYHLINFSSDIVHELDDTQSNDLFKYWDLLDKAGVENWPDKLIDSCKALIREEPPQAKQIDPETFVFQQTF